MRRFASFLFATSILAACGGSGTTSIAGSSDASTRDSGESGFDGAADAPAPDGGGLSDGGACGPIGASCSGASSCCSAYCKASVCTCNADGYACHGDVDCCASDCLQGICGGVMDATPGHDGASDGGGGGGLVLCGGAQNISAPPLPQGPFGDSWVFDGSTWTEGVTMGAPCGGINGAAAALSTEAVAFGGYYWNQNNSYAGGGTATFAGTNWDTLTAKATDPAARMGHAMAALASVVVLFGGNTVTNSGGAYLADTWTFDGTSWSSVAPSSAPSGRSGHVMATLGSGVVLFGGADTTGLRNDTWMFNGTSWNEVSTASAPPARRDAAMATLGSAVVLFGGYADAVGDAGGEVVLLGDTWTFDGTNWTQISPAASPSPRFDHAMAELHGQAVLFGGENSTGATPLSLANYFNDTWVFDGTAWTQLFPPTAPAVRAGHVLSAF